MILAIDIGNTNICIGCIDEKKCYFIERLSTDRSKTDLEYAVSFKNVIELNGLTGREIEGAILSSVVPQLNQVIRAAVFKVIHTNHILTVGPGVKTGLNIQIDDPAKLGSDLVVDAVAAIHEYPLPLIIIDMGTCTTFSAVNEKGSYVGGVITPGVRISLDAMISRTAQLPQVSLEDPGHAIGRNTHDCIQSGILYGNASMVDGMVERISRELQGTPTIIATGGIAPAIIPLCQHSIICDDTLLLKGLYIIYKKNVPA